MASGWILSPSMITGEVAVALEDYIGYLGGSF